MLVQTAMRLLGMLGLALALCAPAAAQVPFPFGYPESSGGLEIARRDKPADQRAAEGEAANAAEAACNTGDLAGCAALGRAFLYGEGRPQNRPVAELLLRQACDGAESEGCLGLGVLLRSLPEPELLAIGAQAFARGCRLGSLEACDREADDLEAGVLGSPDPAAAEALRRATCTAGGQIACRTLAGLLMGRERSEAEREEGRTLIDRLCRAGDARACSEAESHWRGVEDGDGPRTIAYRTLGCAAGDVWSCTEMARWELRQGNGAEAARTRALTYSDRACTLASYHCGTATAIRDQPQLETRCEAGVRASCVTLGHFYSEAGGALENKPRALALLGPACLNAETPAETKEVCELAAYRALALWTQSAAPDPTRAEAYLARACEAGSQDACRYLAEELASGERLPADLPRAFALMADLCETGEADICRELEDQIADDPATPLVLASSEYLPDLSDPETAARLAAEEAAERRADAEERERQCTNTRVTLRGVTYTDRLCYSVPRMINGFELRPGQAPWQALLWRPDVLAKTRLTPEQRVLCGGAVIRTGWVLTAAHCLTDEGGVSVVKGGHRIRLGLANPLADEGYSYPILRAIPHPGFDRKTNTFAFDIALVQYDPKGGTRGGMVYPITRIRLDPQSLEARPIRTGASAFTYGWGRTALEGGEAPDVLRGARLELRDAEACTQITKFRDERKDSVLCAAGSKGEQACFGDSGGPLITYGDVGRVPTVIGVVSAGIKCGQTGVPSRYTRVAHPDVQSWLNQVLPPPIRR
jgi:TPR repeat protein